MVEVNRPLGAPFLQLCLPLLHQRHRHQHKRMAASRSAQATQKRTDLHGLSQAHLVSQDAPMARPVKLCHPCDARALVGVQTLIRGALQCKLVRLRNPCSPTGHRLRCMGLPKFCSTCPRVGVFACPRQLHEIQNTPTGLPRRTSTLAVLIIEARPTRVCSSSRIAGTGLGRESLDAARASQDIHDGRGCFAEVRRARRDAAAYRRLTAPSGASLEQA
mmetsp:Transcript_159543/g.306242  ORF Transcript_159543/g.306242 Transcript_159543/m.306242 type:complete len:218 (+) Transcript_159543:3591-4244(+)